jgi:ATP-binding cassette subfamily B protein
VVEVGPHDELMAKEGAYWRLYMAQLRNVDTEDDPTALVAAPNPTAHGATSGTA